MQTNDFKEALLKQGAGWSLTLEPSLRLYHRIPLKLVTV